MNKINVLIVHAHEVMRLGLRTLLSNRPDFIVVDEAASAKEAIEKTAQHYPDVVVMGIRMPGMNGIEACEIIKEQQPDVGVIMLTSYAEDEMLFDAISAGAAGYVLERGGGEELVRAIQRVGKGDGLLDPVVTQRVLARVRQATRQEQAAAFRGIKKNKLRVLGLVAEGRTNKEISEALGLGEGTIRNHVSSILKILGVRNRAAAAVYAEKNGVFDVLAGL